MLPQKEPTSPTRERRHVLGLRPEDAERLDVGLEARAHRADLHARLELAVDDAHERRHAAVGVVPGVEEERLERRVRIALRRRDVADDPLEQLVDADAHLGRGQDGVVGGDADDLLDLLAGLLGLGRRAGRSC